MASTPIPPFDSGELAQQLGAQLDQHRVSIAAKVGTPAEGPIFRTAPDGSILHRDGTVVASAPKATQPKGA